jgi:hypothetical protein
MKRKKQKSFYQVELMQTRKRLRLARSIDKCLKRFNPWFEKAIHGKSQNDENYLLSPFRRCREVEDFIRGLKNGPKISLMKGDVRVEKGKVAAFGVYIDKTDEIHIPVSVRKSAMFYPVLFHELIHSTAHKGRLVRHSSLYDTKKRRISEELTAEIGSVILCVYFGVATRRSIESAALSIWWNFTKMKNDKRFKGNDDFPDVSGPVDAVKFLLSL